MRTCRWCVHVRGFLFPAGPRDAKRARRDPGRNGEGFTAGMPPQARLVRLSRFPPVVVAVGIPTLTGCAPPDSLNVSGCFPRLRRPVGLEVAPHAAGGRLIVTESTGVTRTLTLRGS